MVHICGKGGILGLRIVGFFGSRDKVRVMAEGATVQLLSPKTLPLVLGEALSPGIRVVTLINRSGLLIACAGEAAASISAIVSSLWQSHEKCDGQGVLGCLLLECEQGRLAVKAVGSFILACCGDTTVPFGLLKAKVIALHDHLLPSLASM
jgi:ragulator complex protein LAMTOR2